LVAALAVLARYYNAATGSAVENAEPHLVLVVIAYKRPAYLKQVLHSLAAASGIEKHTVLFSIEPSDTGVIDMARGFTAAKRSIVHVNEQVQGCYPNIQQALARGFEYGDFVVVVEDDIVLSRDALLWFEHARSTYSEDKRVFTVSAYGDSSHTASDGVPAEYAGTIGRRQHFTPWGWGTWRDRYEEMAGDYRGWDAQMNFGVRMISNVSGTIRQRWHSGLRRDRVEVFPVLSRSNNIGSEGGIHADQFSSTEMKGLQYLHHWAGGQASEAEDSARTGFAELDASLTNALCSAVKFGTDTG
jgi:glycosyltransferase involved in cell wall biosynthesis